MIARRPAVFPGLRRRVALVDDDRGSIALLLLVILVGVALGGLLVPMIISQDRTTRFDTTRVGALDAAQAGLDVMLGNIRKVTTGDSSKLPCPTSPVTGTVNGGPATYSVTVTYYSADPVQNPSATIPCVSGTLTGTVIPSYARLSSTGTVPPAVNGSTNGRTLVSTYQFHTTNSVGGIIAISPVSASSPPLCMDAGPPPTSNGYQVLMQACSTANPPPAQQTFTYRNDLTIQLVSSVTSGTPNGLCLTQPTGTAVTLSTCQPAGTAPTFTQQWSYDQYGAYQTVTARSTVDGSLGTQCMNLASQVAGSQLTLATCDYTAASPAQITADPVQSWVPSRGVGAGAATPPQWTNCNGAGCQLATSPLPQWINYSELGRCLYIPPAVTDHLWSYPCTQDPWALAVPAGQSFTGPSIATGATTAVGALTSGTGSTKTCLTSPTNGGWVTAQSCSAALLQTWTVYNGAPTAYSDKYKITIGSGSGLLCLGLGPPAYTDSWSVIRTEPCTGAADQKWNVPTNALSVAVEVGGN